MKKYYVESNRAELFVGNKLIKKSKKHKRLMTTDRGTSSQALAYCLVSPMVGLLSEVRVCWPVLSTTKPGV